MRSVEARPTSEIGRNSPLREATKPYVEGTAKFLHEKFSWLSADMITWLGVGLNVAGSVLSAHKNVRGDSEEAILMEVLPLVTLALGAGADGFDGPKARLEREDLRIQGVDIKEIREIRSRGQLKDAVSDRVGTLVKGLSRAVAAHKRGDTLGEYLAYVNVITSNFTSITRAKRESKLEEGPENGHDPLEFVGGHVGRSLLDTLSTPHPGYKGRFQRLSDALSIAGSIKSAISRLRKGQPINMEKPREKLQKELGRDITDEDLYEERSQIRKESLERERAMTTMAVISFAAVAVTHETLRGRNPLFGPKQEDPVVVFERSGSR